MPGARTPAHRATGAPARRLAAAPREPRPVHPSSGAGEGTESAEVGGPVDLALRVGVAWRDLRRLSSCQALRERIRGDGPELDLGQADALAALISLGPSRMGELAEALRVDASTATRAVDRLVEAGLAARQRGPDDRRVVLIEATAAGARLHEGWKARARTVMADILAELAEGDRHRLAELMEGLVDAADRYLTEPTRPH